MRRILLSEGERTFGGKEARSIAKGVSKCREQKKMDKDRRSSEEKGMRDRIVRMRMF